jgi:hypothetical protein
MTNNLIPSPGFSVVSIHDMTPKGFLSFDLVQIVEALRNEVQNYFWIVEDIECTDRMPATGVVLSFQELVDLVNKVGQTINATILGYASMDHATQEQRAGTRLRDFPKSLTRVAILAVDSSYFEVFSKDSRITDLIRRAFHDVRVEDPKAYFE